MSMSAIVAAMLLAGALPSAGGPLPEGFTGQVAAPAAEPSPPESAVPVETAAAAPHANPGDIVVTARPRAAPGDPLAEVNAKSFAVTQSVDRAFVGPAALAYQRNIPGPIRSGLHNFLKNLHEPDVFLNFLLQLNPGKAAETLGRFAINSTLGGAGLFDVAKRHPFNLPRRRNGFGDSFGFYGVKPGAYLFLPLIGPTTLRDLVGGGLDRLLLPLAVGTPFNDLAYTVPTGIVSALDRRVEADERLHTLRDDSANPYAAVRTYYLQRRQAEIDDLHAMRHRTAAPQTPVPSPPISR